MKVRLGKFLLATMGNALPLRRHPGGKAANALRCLFAGMIVDEIGKGCIIEKGAEIM